MAVIFPAHLRVYHLKQALQYIYDNGYHIDTTGIEDTIAQLEADIADPDAYDDPGEARTYFDTRCNGEGIYSKQNDTGLPEDASKYIHCITCDGQGATKSAVEPQIIRVWPVVESGVI